MTHRRERILVAILLVVAASYAVAEDLTLTTYYPSPRGVYQELRTQGDVGIGNISAAPNARLHVTQTDAATAFRVDDEAGDTTPFLIRETGDVEVGGAIVLTGEVSSPLAGLANLIHFGPGADGYYIARVNKNDPINERIQISVADSPPGTGTMFVVNKKGHVGIGTTTPRIPLDVNGGIVSTKNLYFKADTGLYLGIGELTTATADWATATPPAVVTLGTNLFGMGWNKDTGKIGMRIPAGTSFDIFGSLATSANLAVGGNGNIAGDLTIAGALNLPASASPFTIARDVNVTAGNITVSPGTVTATTVYGTSDARLKTDFLPVNGALDKVGQLRGMSFAWDPARQPASGAAGTRHIGVIAQDVEAAFPELVSSWGPEGYKAVDYGGLTAVLLEAIKELRQENATLQQRLELLERRMGTQEDGS